MSGSITLSASIRSNLLSLQNTTDLIGQTNSRLTSQKKVSSAVDDAVAYFQAKSLDDRSSDLTARKAGIDQGISSLTTAMTGLTSVESILGQMKGIMLSCKSASAENRSTLTTQLKTLATQLNQLANDANYQGLNLVNSTATNLKVQFSEKSDAFIQVDGFNSLISNGTMLTGFTMDVSGIITGGKISALVGTGILTQLAGFSEVSNSVSIFDNYINAFDTGISTVRGTMASVGSNIALLQTRSDFTKNYCNTLTEGAGKLTLADLNEEGANLVSLQTRQQLGIQALSFAGRMQQGILSLFQ